MVKKFIIYIFRWQLSTPILWLVVHRLGVGIASTVIANLIGASIFFWVDRFIFKAKHSLELWQIKEGECCQHCGRKTSLWRLVKTENYDRTDASAVFLCRSCSQRKVQELKERGVNVAFCHTQ